MSTEDFDTGVYFGKDKQPIYDLSLITLQKNSNTLSNLIYGYVLAIRSGRDTKEIALGIDTLLDEVRKQFNDISEKIGDVE